MSDVVSASAVSDTMMWTVKENECYISDILPLGSNRFIFSQATNQTTDLSSITPIIFMDDTTPRNTSPLIEVSRGNDGETTVFYLVVENTQTEAEVIRHCEVNEMSPMLLPKLDNMEDDDVKVLYVNIVGMKPFSQSKLKSGNLKKSKQAVGKVPSINAKKRRISCHTKENEQTKFGGSSQLRTDANSVLKPGICNLVQMPGVNDLAANFNTSTKLKLPNILVQKQANNSGHKGLIQKPSRPVNLPAKPKHQLFRQRLAKKDANAAKYKNQRKGRKLEFADVIVKSTDACSKDCSISIVHIEPPVECQYDDEYDMYLDPKTYDMDEDILNEDEELREELEKFQRKLAIAQYNKLFLFY